jgi:L-fucose isomerase-like protein
MAKSKSNGISKSERTVALALLAVGISRESASLSIGKPSQAIAELFQSDPAFAKEVLKAEMEAEQYYISRLREASQDPRGWRAAAWMLERRQPERYGVCKPETLTKELLEKFINYFFTVLVEEVPDAEIRKRIQERMKQYVQIEEQNRRERSI